jgi:putative aldouronate transport system permease protein
LGKAQDTGDYLRFRLFPGIHALFQKSNPQIIAFTFSKSDAIMKKNHSIFHDIRNNSISYALAIPAVVYTLIFGYFTLPYMIIAFKKFNFRKGLLGSEWVGLNNFDFFFRSQNVIKVIANTVKLNFLFIVCTTLTAVLLAVFINEIHGKWFKKICQSTYLFPYFISWVLISYILFGLLGTDYGLLNNIRNSLGLVRISFYNESQHWTGILTLLKIWKDTGIKVVIYLAIIAGFDSDIYEAAIIDGANRLQICWRLTIQMLFPSICLLGIMDLGKIFYGDFGMIYAIIGDNGLLYETTDVIDTFMFRILRTTGNPSQAMAIGLFQAIMGFIAVYTANTIARKNFSEGALF